MKLSLYYCDSLNLLLFRLKKETKIAKIGYFNTDDFQSTISKESFVGKVFYIQTEFKELDTNYKKIISSLPNIIGVIESLPVINHETQKYFIYVIIGKPIQIKKKPEAHQIRSEKQEMREWMIEKKDFIRDKSNSLCYL